MKVKLLAGLGILFLVSQVYGEDLVLKEQKDKVSYSIGINLGKNFKTQQIDINPDILLRGIKDGFSGNKQLLNDQEVNQTMMTFQEELMARQQELRKRLGEKNMAEGEAFLAENKKREGIKTLPDGLQYKVIKEGSGNKPTLSDTVTTHYKGTLIDGTEFDSSYRRGQPATFPVNGVVAGWTEALQLMTVGSKWQLFIPPDLAYGERGTGRGIGPNATLIFEIELISIQEKKEGEKKDDLEKKEENKKSSSPQAK